ncbi:CLAVATA3/ESR (CLE)-related protein 46-like isoform X1 [Melia azedarach]|uniref:CLAVATA3/ESR (CLE)-related protein 46-like isoform X1 n=1 Tax=Melia azedarach TaxID=155640 RepID=A0ACC1Y9L0_MELAZ|nr:CLAVATA3/ESR (CLE)-related protein 46-like isoform X1 [Melia azedarach]
MRKPNLCIALMIILVVSYCNCSTAIRIHAAESVNFNLEESAHSRMSISSRYIVASWVSKIKSRKLVKDNSHKVPSGPNPIGNWHPPLASSSRP